MMGYFCTYGSMKNFGVLLNYYFACHFTRNHGCRRCCHGSLRISAARDRHRRDNGRGE
jgi:hypothetical protein